MSKGISFLYNFDLGNRDLNNPGINILRVTSTAVGDFDKANLTTESINHVWRSTNSTNLHEIVIKAEIKSNIDTFAILGHNFSETAIVRVQANVSDQWTAPPFNQIIPIDTEQNNLVLCSDGFGGEYEYYRVTILDPANPCGYLEVGRIIGGRAFIFTQNEDITDDYNVDYKDESETMNTQGYYRASNEGIIVRNFSATFSKLYTVPGKDENYRNFNKMFKIVKTTRPFLTILERAAPSVFNIWGQLTSLPKKSFGVNKFVNYSINVEEIF